MQRFLINAEDGSLIEAAKMLLGEYHAEYLRGGITVNAKESNLFKGYKITKKGAEAKIYYSDKPSFFCALTEVLARYTEDFEKSASRCTTDLGLMLDCSRNNVMHVDGIKKLIRVLVCLGFNYLELYTEDTYEIKDEPYFGHLRGRFTKEEINELDAYGKKFGFELVPCIQTLAHLNAIFNWVRFDRVRDVADILLLRNEESYQLIEKMLKSVREAFSSKRINLGMDEAHLLGAGKFLDKNGYVPRREIMLEHIGKVTELCKKYGFRPSMWNDMFYRMVNEGDYYGIPEDFEFDKKYVENLPDIDMIYWDYYNEDVSVYRKMIRTGKQLGKKLTFAGGAWKWGGFTPNNEASIRRTKLALQACRESGIDDVLVTAWGDNGGECPIFSVLPSLFTFSEMAYSGEMTAQLNEKCKVLTNYSFDEFLKVDLPNSLCRQKDGKVFGNCSKFFLLNDPLLGIMDYHVPENAAEVFSQNAVELMLLAGRDSEFSYLFKTYSALCDVLSIKADLGVKITAAYKAKDNKALLHIADQDIPSLQIKFDRFYNVYRETWMHDSKPFGFEVILERLGGMMLRLRYVVELLHDYVDGKVKNIPELEQERLPILEGMERGDCSLEHNASWHTFTPSIR